MTETTNIENEIIKLDISSDNKTTILLNVEEEVKQLINKLATQKKDLVESEFIDGNEKRENILNALPNSMTGIVIHYFCKGLKDDFDVEFKEQPVSLKIRASSNYDKKIASKKRLLTKQQKNELLESMNLSYYQDDISNNKITIDDAMQYIKNAFAKKEEFESMGYVLPTKKTESPYWKGEG
jgi:hypothetical protein